MSSFLFLHGGKQLSKGARHVTATAGHPRVNFKGETDNPAGFSGGRSGAGAVARADGPGGSPFHGLLMPA